MTNQEKIAMTLVTLQHAKMSVTLHGLNVKFVATVNAHAIASVQMAVHVLVTLIAVNQMSTDMITVLTTTWTMISLTASKTTVMYHVNAFNHVSMTLTNALSTVPVMPPVFKLVKIMKNSANQIAHAMKNVQMVAHALVGAVNFHVTQSGLISEIVAKTSVWSSGTTARHHVVMDKIPKSA